MRTIVEKREPLPASVETHPSIVEHTRRKQEIATTLAATRAANARLVAKRDEAREHNLNVRAAAVCHGHSTGAEDASALEAIDAELAQVADAIQVLERAAGQHDIDGRAVRAAVREDMRQHVQAEITRTVATVNEHLDVVEPLIQRLMQLRQYGLASVPMGSLIVLDAIQKFRRG